MAAVYCRLVGVLVALRWLTDFERDPSPFGGLRQRLVYCSIHNAGTFFLAPDGFVVLCVLARLGYLASYLRYARNCSSPIILWTIFPSCIGDGLV